MTIAPGVKSAIFISDWVAARIRLCHAPRLRIIRWLIDSWATSPSDFHEDERETALSPICGGTGEDACNKTQIE